MINPAFNPLAASLIAANNPTAVLAAPPAQSVTARPTTPANKKDGPRSRDRRDTEEENKDKKPGQRGSATDLTV